ncbi:ABC transporter permease [Myceligenerans xiligouense]|uniref:Osmoprotectant transport system permease protein n=1 Tax=Myceligenerans xiligouense TaxID=253184 RepID=A0A3N4YSJ8_9MICO|nr:ABC transporter permease [Myceligenerans xiligouense]RPF22364.1 osmoprotectant transport system permease protein [Myceligenerans xiligouense]
MAANPWFSWTYVVQNAETLWEHTVQHAALTVQAVAVAAAIAVPLGILVSRVRRLSGVVIGTAAVLYTVPSLALFAILAPLLGIGRTPVFIGLVIYALLVILRNTVAGIDGVDPAVLDAARGLGYGPVRVLVHVALPNALPSVVAGLRLATVSTVALVTVGVVVGYGGLGQLMFQGFRNNFYRAEIMTATLACVLLALVLDIALWAGGRALTPWRERSHA